MGKFTLDLEGFEKSASKNVDLIVRKIVFDVGTSLVEKTPVGNPDLWKHKAPPGYVGGRLRANWQYGVNAPNLTTTLNTDKTGAATTERFNSSIEANAGGKKHYFANSLPYAQRIENGDWSTQAPQGMVGITVVEFVPIVNRAIVAVRSGQI